ncbi:hypothetical protein ACTA71_012698 [Dictyostelium dimigraforme]
METLIFDLTRINLSEIGRPDFPAQQKENDAKKLNDTFFNGVNLVINLKNDIKSITYYQCEVFNRKLSQNVKDVLQGIVQSEHAQVYYDPELTQSQKNIIIYCLLPIYYLPNYRKQYNPDKTIGEKTFSKMLLNIAVMHSRIKFEYVSGYYDFHQETLKKTPLRVINY